MTTRAELDKAIEVAIVMYNETYRGNCKTELRRIAVQHGVELDGPLNAFVAYVAARIDVAYELGKRDGIKQQQEESGGNEPPKDDSELNEYLAKMK